jgi:phosphatidylglycerol:prolipoprotein diacylglycerol transferase
VDQASRGELFGFKVEASEGAPAVVGRVDAGSAAEAAGLQKGDVVQAVNGVDVNSLSEARDAMFQSYRDQQVLQLGIRGGRNVTFAPNMPPRSRPVHPTQIYSAIDAGLLSWLLWSFFPFRTRDGQCIALLLTIHPITRFLLEVIRTDEPAVFGTGLSISQNISILLLACAAVLWWYLSRRPAGIVWPLVPTGSLTRAESTGTAAKNTKRHEKRGNPIAR